MRSGLQTHKGMAMNSTPVSVRAYMGPAVTFSPIVKLETYGGGSDTLFFESKCREDSR